MHAKVKKPPQRSHVTGKAIKRSISLSITERAVLHTINIYINNITGIAYPLVKQLARDCNIKVRAMQYVLASLVKKGWLARTLPKRDGTASIYRITPVESDMRAKKPRFVPGQMPEKQYTPTLEETPCVQ